MKTCTVLIAAHNADKWIDECLRSITRQYEVPGWTCRFAVAVDACSATSDKLTRLRYSHYWSPENVGPYLLRNSMAKLHPADAYATFDADDVMFPEYLRTLLAETSTDTIVGAGRATIREDGTEISRYFPYQHGVSIYAHPVFAAVGGFRPWPIAADWDLVQRAKHIGFSVHGIEAPLYYRRRHDESLTRQNATELHGPYRNALKLTGDALIEEGDIHANFQTAELEYRRV